MQLRFNPPQKALLKDLFSLLEKEVEEKDKLPILQLKKRFSHREIINHYSVLHRQILLMACDRAVSAIDDYEKATIEKGEEINVLTAATKHEYANIGNYIKHMESTLPKSRLKKRK